MHANFQDFFLDFSDSILLYPVFSHHFSVASDKLLLHQMSRSRDSRGSHFLESPLVRSIGMHTLSITCTEIFARLGPSQLCAQDATAAALLARTFLLPDDWISTAQDEGRTWLIALHVSGQLASAAFVDWLTMSGVRPRLRLLFLATSAERRSMGMASIILAYLRDSTRAPLGPQV